MAPGLVDLIRSKAEPGEDVAIVYAFGHVLARQANVRNVYRYTDDQSLVLRTQLQELMQRIATQGVRQVFGRVAKPLMAELETAGFHQTKELGDFSCWTRDGE